MVLDIKRTYGEQQATTENPWQFLTASEGQL